MSGLALPTYTPSDQATTHFLVCPPFSTHHPPQSRLNLALRPNFALSLVLSTSSASNLPETLTSSSALGLPLSLPRGLIQLSASSLLLLAFSLLAFSPRASAKTFPLSSDAHSSACDFSQQTVQDDDLGKTNLEDAIDKEMDEAFEKWKSKTFALTVPLRIVALRGSVPPPWIKGFIQSQGKRLKLSYEVRGGLEEIFSQLLSKGPVDLKSAVTSDLVTVGDSWLNLAIRNGAIEPLESAEEKGWFRNLNDIWKIYLRRNSEGKLDSDGMIWGVPYRWGSMVIMYKKSKFDKYGLAPIEDWADLWRPELAGRISMIDSPREVVGAVLKYMGASYNTSDIDRDIAGGINSVQQNLALLAKQVRLFDSKQYLKAFAVGDVWVAVGWSSDILPASKRTSNVAVIVPKSGASLWADLWAVPALINCGTSKVGGRIRGPSPLIHQWLDFCLQPAREVPFKKEVVPGASPSTLGCMPTDVAEELVKRPSVSYTNLIAGLPPPEVLARCEFLEPLSEATLSDYRKLISSLQMPASGLIQVMQQTLLSTVRTIWKEGGSKI